MTQMTRYITVALCASLLILSAGSAMAASSDAGGAYLAYEATKGDGIQAGDAYGGAVSIGSGAYLAGQGVAAGVGSGAIAGLGVGTTATGVLAAGAVTGGAALAV